MRCKVTQKLLITSKFVHFLLDKKRFFISFTVHLGDLAKFFVSLSAVRCKLRTTLYNN